MERSFWSTIRGKIFSRTLLMVATSGLMVALATIIVYRLMATDTGAAGDLRRLSIVLIATTFVVTVVTGAVALRIAQDLASPIARLRNSAVDSAEALPLFIAHIDEFGPDHQAPELPALMLQTNDEAEDLARSFHTLQETATRLAVEEARVRRNNLDTFVNLGRRNQNLLARQMECISAMEADEANPEVLQQLFQLDHLATRMRRNAESLLVLAGEEAPRRFRKTVSIHQLVQAASGEIEQFDRIDFASIEDSAIDGTAAPDLAHLIAELLENATAFSPPGASIQVHGQRANGAYWIDIVDGGIGMDEAALEQANARVKDPSEFRYAASAPYLGHFVVGHLAARHGIEVELSSLPGQGVTARLRIPGNFLSSDDNIAPTSVTLTESPEEQPMKPKTAGTVLTTSDWDIAQLEAIDGAVFTAAEVEATPAHEPIVAASVPASTPTSSPATASSPTAASPDGAASVELTPSGFRRRRRGQEGAPEPMTPRSRDVDDAPARRTPEEIQQSLQRFRRGVETGREQARENPPLSMQPKPGEAVQ